VSDERLVMLLFGPPGCGKGTQGALLAKHYRIPTISTGDILRAAVREGTPLGEKAKSLMDKGQLVPDAVMLDLIGDRLSQEDVANGFILDGFPRTVAQADGLDRVLEEKGTAISRVVNLQVTRDKLIDRLTSRRVCTRCGATYNVRTLPPPPEGACADPVENCHGEHVIQRADDGPETVPRRLDVYEELTAPLVAYYADRGVLTHVDGDGPLEAVFDRVTAVFA
jgi:adenylate kinase